jgi:adenylate cyclase
VSIVWAMMLNEDQLATKAGATVALVREMSAAGLLPPSGPFDMEMVTRVRLAVELQRSGLAIQSVAQIVAEGQLSLEAIDRSLFRPHPIGLLGTTYSQLAGQLGMSAEFAGKVHVALGLSDTTGGSPVREDDAETMAALTKMVRLGLTEDVVATLFEIFTDNIRRTARASSEMWHAGVLDPILARGVPHRELLGLQSINGDQFLVLGERVIMLLWNRFLDDEIFRGTIETLSVALEEAGVSETRDDQPPAIAFLDLTAFTHLTDGSGDSVAAASARDLAAVVRRTSVSWGGTLVKMLGDGAMLHFRDSTAAVSCCIALVDDIERAGLPPARFGLDSGPIIARDVDFFGHTVNVAARLVDYARPGEVLVTMGVVQAAASEDLTFSKIGPVSLKGVASLVTVYSASRSG